MFEEERGGKNESLLVMKRYRLELECGLWKVKLRSDTEDLLGKVDNHEVSCGWVCFFVSTRNGELLNLLST